VGDGKGERVAVPSHAALKATVDQLDAAARGDMPCTIELYHGEGRCLMILVQRGVDSPVVSRRKSVL